MYFLVFIFRNLYIYKFLKSMGYDFDNVLGLRNIVVSRYIKFLILCNFCCSCKV